jgi:DNA polymerase-1
MIALIDADIVVYQSAAKAETIVDWGDDEIIITGSKTQTKNGIEDMVNDLTRVLGADRVVLAFTDEQYFRKDVYPAYKGNRKGVRKPVTYGYGKEFALDKYETMVRPGLEADDILGILSTTTVKGFQGDKVVCSLDKDMLTFPGRVYNWSKPNDGVVIVDEDTADYNFYMQILMGDSTDGYPGCPGIGKVRAARILDECFVLPPAKTGVEPYFDKPHAWAEILKAYHKKDLTRADAVVQAQCARILRAEDYDFDNHTPILWQP